MAAVQHIEAAAHKNFFHNELSCFNTQNPVQCRHAIILLQLNRQNPIIARIWEAAYLAALCLDLSPIGRAFSRTSRHLL